MPDKFKALVLNQAGENFTREVKEVDKDFLKHGDVLVKVDYSTLNFKDALIGINNRNLKTLKTDINTTYDIYEVVKNHRGPLISESGIKTKEELVELNKKTSINTFL